MSSLFCSWEIIHACNFRCPYCFFIKCWESAPEDTNTRHAGCSSEDWLAFWSRIHGSSGSFKIEITGGEPFLYPGFIPLVEKISRLHLLRIITNLSAPVSGIVERLDPQRVRFHSSFHPHFAKIEDFLDKNLALRARGFHVTTTAVAYPPIFDQLRHACDLLQSSGIPFWVAPYQGTYEGVSYPEGFTDEQRAWLYASHAAESRRAFAYGVEVLRPLGKLCAAGQKYFRAYPDGWIHRCSGAKDVPGAKAMGNIKDPDFQMLSAPSPCPAARCFSPMEYHHLGDVAEKDRWRFGW
ncbi:MAG: radical SAM protein [Elusimicrobia bacterium]|nr:radical SAM protein [Elusimicrobiota bacterium]